MPESKNTTLTELSARYFAGGEDAIIQRFPEERHFLVVPPEREAPPSLVWTGKHIQLTGTTKVCDNIKKENLPIYAIPSAVVTPISKRNRNDDKFISVGRSDSSDIRLDSEIVSKVHAKFRVKAERITLSEMGSTNGTFINDCRLMAGVRYHLSPGSEVKFADVKSMYVDLEHLMELVKLVT